ncbi:hypothetical protein FEM48_Zijuj06G0073400 [Ziziphus jujuba var. spinosa]|uniref:Uncharacterized protein n=1 Tax=Ziziphus jujuba var. spinosa TaxID=714518 RepID=A0A978V7X9_ZIZJJ|nr:hypothetical protein FEM48_Zijuj06G0073400 [Ziziphus jujuba var. spinosa]
MQVSMDFLIPNLNTSIIALCAIVILVIISYLILHRGVDKSKVAIAPEAKGSWPIIGHLPLLGGSTPPRMHRALVVSNCEMAKECFTINDLQVLSRPKLIATKHFSYNHAMFGFAPYGTYWCEIRKITTLHLLSNRRIELLKHIRIAEVAIFLKQLYGFWTEKKNLSDQALEEMKPCRGDMTLNVILKTVAGKRYSTGPGDVGGKKESWQTQEGNEGILLFGGLVWPGDVIPFLRFLDLGGYERVMKKTAKELDDTLDRWLQEHKRKRERGTDQLVKEEQDFMDVMLSVPEDYSDIAGHDGDTINKSTTLVIAY